MEVQRPLDWVFLLHRLQVTYEGLPVLRQRLQEVGALLHSNLVDLVRLLEVVPRGLKIVIRRAQANVQRSSGLEFLHNL